VARSFTPMNRYFSPISYIWEWSSVCHASLSGALVVGALPASEVSAFVFTGTAQTRVMRADVTVRAMAIVAFASVWKLTMEGVVLLVRHQS
jgi:hypothetical protein